MILDPLDIPEELLEAQEQGRLVVFVGAGVSRGSPSDLPDFEELAAWVAKDTRFEHNLSKHKHRLDRYFGELVRGDVKIQDLVRQRIGVPTSLPTDVHRSVLSLFLDPKDIRIVTTNFDKHFSSVVAERNLKCDHFFAPALPLGRNFRGIVYLHGSLLRADDPLVLSDEDFGRAYLTEGWARDFLRGLFDSYTTLFIGYSHTDPPVEYLARGMSASRVAPRYALVSKGEEEWWNSLKVKPITFEKPGGTADFAELSRGLHNWAQFSKDQPTDIAQKVQNIVLSPPEVKPAASQSSFLVRCLGRKDSCHFFTSNAIGWHWVKWADEQGLIKPLFGKTSGEFGETQWQFAIWLANMLVTESSDQGFLLVAGHGGTVGRDLWQCLWRRLCTVEKIDYTSLLIHKWVLLLISSCPEPQKSDLGHLLLKVAKVAPKPLGLLLFRILTEVRVTVSSGFSIDFTSDPDNFATSPQAEFDMVLVGESYQLEQAWETAFKPMIPELWLDYLRIFNARMHEMFGVLKAAGKADYRFDPWCMRPSIRERDAYREYRNNAFVLDCLLDVVEIISEQSDGLPGGLIEDWLAAECPTLVRVGMLALQLSKNHTGIQKLKLLADRGLIYPAGLGAQHEVISVLVACYPQLSVTEKAELWQIIATGPKHPAGEGVTPEEWLAYCQQHTDKLTGLLATRNQLCPLAADALAKLIQRSPEFRRPEKGEPGIPAGAVVDEGQSPKSAAELLAQTIDAQIDFLLAYKDAPWPPGASRAGLVATVGDACAQNSQWAISLFSELEKRQNWTSDLWDGAFWRLRLATLPPEKLIWLLGIFEQHFAKSANLQGLTFFLFNGVEFTDQKAPPPEILQALIRISILIWEQLKAAEPRKTDEFEKTGWTGKTINHPAGRIAEFWIKCWSYLRQQSTDLNGGWPEWLQAPLADMAAGESYAAQLGRVSLGQQMPFVHAVDSAWARAKLFPKFDFAQVGDEAFLLWEPHLKHGRLSRDLIIEMLPLYRQAFLRFRNVGNDLANQLYKHLAVIIGSCLVDVNADGLLKEFLLGLSEEQRAAWANQMEFVLRNYSHERKQAIWDKWMKDYWQGRLVGKPCHLAGKEAGEMVKWALFMEPAFSSAVNFVVQGPRVQNRIGSVLFQLEKKKLLQTQPQAVLKLFAWLVSNSTEDWFPSDDLIKTIMALPKKKNFVRDLTSICEYLAKRGYPKAVELKAEILKLFVED